jgi:uncharacterized protein involved in type VI secretion and phage assembly
MSRLIDIVRHVVQQEMAHNRGAAMGVVTTLFPHEAEDDENNYEVNVRLKYEELELRRVPMAVTHMGVAVPPRVGDLVLVQFINGDMNQPVVTGRFYHDGERPPLHHQDEFLYEQRLTDGTLNHLRFSDDGAIFLQRDVTAPEDNSQARAGVKIDPDGNIEIKAGDSIVITLTNENDIKIKADGKQVTIDCQTLTVNGDLVVSGASGTTTISGTTITGS